MGLRRVVSAARCLNEELKSAVRLDAYKAGRGAQDGGERVRSAGPADEHDNNDLDNQLMRRISISSAPTTSVRNLGRRHRCRRCAGQTARDRRRRTR
jgi:hypothetical protein